MEVKPSRDDDCGRSVKSAKRKPGIVYLSSIPPGFNVSETTAFFGRFGLVDRVFLQPDPVEKARSRDGRARNFTEGWVEFSSKRVAKVVAESLNRTQVRRCLMPGLDRHSMWLLSLLGRRQEEEQGPRRAVEHQVSKRLQVDPFERTPGLRKGGALAEDEDRDFTGIVFIEIIEALRISHVVVH